jgi:alanyl-tRNA synthetase
LLCAALQAGHIIPFDAHDNFWEMGDTGPCGPCTELHYDRIGGRDAASIVNMDDPDVIEIWNLVFMQMNRNEDRSLDMLPAKHIDTGMGFERIVSILQDKPSNYDTDLFIPLFAAIKEATGTDHEYSGKLGMEDVGAKDTAYRVIADHIRTITVAITDGAMPDKIGRGYVLRRVVRRAVRFGRECLGAQPGFFHKLVPTVVEMLGDAFPELHSKPDFVMEVIADEEEQFGRTLSTGTKRFNKFADAVKATGGTVIPGPQAFQLYDSYGFPFDLTIMMAEEKGMTVDMDGYHEEMKRQQEQSKGKKGASKKMVLEAAQTDYLEKAGVAPTDDSTKYTWNITPTCAIKAIYTEDGFKDTAATGEHGTFGVILDSTPFYAEQGGQIYDTGVLLIESDDNDVIFEVSDCQKFGAYVLHIGELKAGSVKLEDGVTVTVDYSRRERIAPNHSCTHSLNYALRQVLAGGVNDGKIKIDQRGSLNTPEILRFDFTYGKAMTADQLEEVEKIVSADVKKDLKVYIQESPLPAAKKINTLRAVFGEAYPDPVRVVSVGVPVDKLLSDPENPEWMKYSVEFCGGTHVESLGSSKAFVVSKEEAISKGVRRVYGLTGLRAEQAIKDGLAIGAKITAAEKLSGAALDAQVKVLKREVDDAEVLSAPVRTKLRARVDACAKKVNDEKKAKAAALKEVVQAEAVAAAGKAASDGVGALLLKIDSLEADAKLGKGVVEAAQKAAPGLVIMAVSATSDKAMLLVSVPKPLQGALKAGDIVKEIMPTLGGKGGGKPNFAQGQGANVGAVAGAIEAALKMATDKLDGASSLVVDCSGSGGGSGGADPAEVAKMSSEDYLAKYKLQENLEELINMVLKEKPSDPYNAMADFLTKVKV